MRKSFIIFCLLSIYVTHTATGQEEGTTVNNEQSNMYYYDFASYEGSEYHKIIYSSELSILKTPIIKSIGQDRLGFMWYATDEGFVRFDGLNHVRYADSVYSNYTKYFFLRRNGELIAITDNELLKINTHVDKDQVRFTTLLKRKMNPPKTDEVYLSYPKLIYEDNQGNIWISNNNSLLLYDTKNVFKQFHFDKKNTSNDFKRSFSIVEDKEGNIYTFSEPGFLYIYQKDEEIFKEIALSESLGKVRHALLLDNNIALVATERGLCELDLNNHKYQVTVKRFFINFDISYLKTHSGKILMAVANKGLYKIQMSTEEEEKYQESRVDGIDEAVINHIFENTEKDLWLSTDNGVIQLTEEIFFPRFKSLSTLSISDIRGDISGNIYFTDGDKVFKVEKRK